MQDYSKAAKSEYGKLMLQLREGGAGLSEKEWALAKALEGMGLVEYFGPDPRPRISTPADAWRDVALAANAVFRLSPRGHDLVARYSAADLQAGRYLLPGEVPWYDRFPWKLVWPAIVSIVMAVLTVLLKERWLK